MGKVITDFGFPSLEVEKMAKLEMKDNKTEETEAKNEH
jgi:hypothetical protein